MSVSDPGLWYNRPPEVVSFGAVLVEAHYIDDLKDLQYYYERPEKWNTEHELWEGSQRPDRDDESWEFFLRKLEQLVGL